MTRTIERQISFSILCPANAQELIKQMGNVLFCVNDKYKQSAVFDIFDEGDGVVHIRISYQEPETEEEMKNRLRKRKYMLISAIDQHKKELSEMESEYKSLE